jgi:hypothetical protein
MRSTAIDGNATFTMKKSRTTMTAPASRAGRAFQWL